MSVKRENIFGQRKACEYMESLPTQERIPRFFIITGPNDHGKTLLTEYLANCLGVPYMVLENKVSTVRELVKSSNKRNQMLYHFTDFEKASEQAKGALLKVAEETPPGVYIVITVNDSQFLQTLISRATVIRVEPYENKDLVQYGQLLGMRENKVKLLSTMGIDSPTKLKRLYALDTLGTLDDLTDVVIDYATEIMGGSVTNISVAGVYRTFQHAYKKDETDMVVLFLTLLKNYLVKTMPNCLHVVQLIDDSLITISNIPTINRQFVLSSLFLSIGEVL